MQIICAFKLELVSGNTAREMSDQAAADNLREEAARYRAEADTIDPTDAYKRATLFFAESRK